MNGLSTFKFLNSHFKLDCMYFLQAGDFILERKYQVEILIKEITCRKNKLVITAIKSALKSLRVGGETGARPTPRTG